MEYMDQRSIHQGELYWAQLARSNFPHPVVIVEVLDGESSGSAVVCPLTTNPKRVSYPGNVRIEKGEGGLNRASIVEVAKALRVDQHQLGAYIGRLSLEQLEQIQAGIRFVQRLMR